MTSQSNSQRLGAFVADAMERMEEDLPDAKLGEIMLICEFQATREDGTSITTVRTTCTDPREFVQLGLLRSSQIAAEGRRSPER